MFLVSFHWLNMFNLLKNLFGNLLAVFEVLWFSGFLWRSKFKNKLLPADQVDWKFQLLCQTPQKQPSIGVLIKSCNFIEIVFRHGCSPVNSLHIFRTPFPRNTWRAASDPNNLQQPCFFMITLVHWPVHVPLEAATGVVL